MAGTEVIELRLEPSARLRNKPDSAMMLVSQGLKNFTANAKHFVAVNKKLCVYNKSPSVIKIFHRTSLKFVDVTLSGEVAQLSAVGFESDVFLAVIANGDVQVIRASESPSNELSATLTPAFTFPGPAAGASGTGARKSTNIVVVLNNGDVLDAQTADATFTKLATVRGGGGRCSAGHGSIAIAQQHGEVAVISAKDGSPLLDAPWFPHGDDGCGEVHVFNHDYADGLHIATCSVQGNEIMIWAIDKRSPVLLQSISIVAEPPASTKFSFAVEADDQYMLVSGGKLRDMCVLTLSPEHGKAVRSTQWDAEDEALVGAVLLTKVKTESGDVVRELSAVVRTTTNLKRLRLDSASLDGPPNLTLAGASSPKTAAAADVTKWFSGPVQQRTSAGNTTTTVTQISASGSKHTVVDANSVQRRIEEEVRRTEQNMAASLFQLTDGVKQLNGLAHANMSALRSEQLVKVANDVARQNAQDLRRIAAQKLPAAARQPSPTPSGSIDAAAIDRVAESAKTGAKQALSESLTAMMRAAMPAALDRAWPSALDKEKELVFPKPTALPSMQAFAEAVDKMHFAQADILRRQKEQDTAKYRAFKTTIDTAKASTEASRAYLAELKRAVEETSAELKTFYAGPAAASPDEILAAVEELARKGQWKQSLTRIVEAGNVSLLLRFLESDLASQHRHDIASDDNMSTPLFVSLMQQLSTGLRDSLGLVPLRLEWMNIFIVAWDEKTAKDGKSAEDQRLLRESAVIFSNVMDSLNEIQARTELDRHSKRNMLTIKKAFGDLALH